MEDTNFGNMDYNDMIVEVANAPEPSALLLVFAGLLSGGFWVKKRRLATA
jgi:hypothetical protein